MLCVVISEPGREPDILSSYHLDNDELSLLTPPIPSSFLSSNQPKNIRKRRLYFAQRYLSLNASSLHSI